MPPQSSSTPFERFAIRLADLAWRHPWRVVAAVLMVVAVSATGLPRLGFSDNFRTYFGPDNPELLTFEELEATYAKSDDVLFVVRPASGDVFDREALDLIETLTEEAWRLPHASRVDSITNFQHSWADGDDLTVEDLVRGAVELDSETLEARRAVALAEPALRGLLISDDATTTGVRVVFQLPEATSNEVPETVAAARALAAKTEQAMPGTEVALSGLVMLNHAFNESGQHDGATLIPAMYTLLVIIMIVALRNVWASAAALAVVVLATVMALGMAGHLGIALSPIAMTAPTIIMTLAIADSIHILVAYLGGLRAGHAPADAMRDAVRVNAVPVLVTSLSTAVGFLALNFADTPPFHDLGNITALGIVSAWFLSLTLLPATVRLLPSRPPRAVETGGWLDRLGARVVRHHRRVLVGSIVVAAVLVGLLPTIELNDQWVRYFDPRVDFRQAADLTDEHLTGLYHVELSMPAGEPEGISDPEYLRRLDAFTAWLRDQHGVRHVTSYADTAKRLQQNLHADDPAFYAMPTERQEAAQALLLYELSLPYGLDLGDRIAVDKSATRVTAFLDGDMTTRETRALLDRMTDWLDAEAPASMRGTPSGLGVMFAYISERNIESMLRGNVLAVLLIAGIMMLALRSVGLGLLSLIPNTVPILMTYGVWAAAVGQVGMAAATVSVSSLGIVVDDTVHFLTKYQRARREHGLTRSEAIRRTFTTVGHAIVTTTVILTAGFLVLTLSTFRINFELGLLTAIAMVLALLADFTLLPALLLAGRSERQEPS